MINNERNGQRKKILRRLCLLSGALYKKQDVFLQARNGALCARTLERCFRKRERLREVRAKGRERAKTRAGNFRSRQAGTYPQNFARASVYILKRGLNGLEADDETGTGRS